MKTTASRAGEPASERVLERLLRGIALLIVVAAIVDPVFTVRRPVRAVVSLLSSDSVQQASILARAERALSGVATVVRGPVPDAQAVVVVGSTWPEAATRMAANNPPPHFVIPLATTSGVHLEVVHAPSAAQRGARSAIRVRLARDAGRGPVSVLVQLRDGEPLHAQRAVELLPGSRHVVSLPYMPVRDGVRSLRVDVIDGPDTVRHALPVHVDETPWRVFVFDARPSWLSTFVRRALERDERFAVSSRIVTARDVSVATPQSVRSLESLAALAATDASALPQVIVVGAPERLSPRDVSALASLMATWGRAVLLLPDHLPTGSGIESMNTLLGVSAWRSLPAAPTSAPRRVLRAPGYPGDSVSLAVSEAATPVALPADATPLASLRAPADDAPLVWMRPVGNGLVLVSSAFDTWRFRDAAQSTFDATWRELVADAARDVGPALSLVALSAPSMPQAAMVEAHVIARSPTDDTNAAAPSVVLVRDAQAADSIVLPLYRTERADTWLAQVRAPTAGLWQLRATRPGTGADADAAVMPLRITPDNTESGRLATPFEQLETFSLASGGRIVAPGAIDSLPGILETRLGLPRQSAPWRPMRSPWWILPLTLALGGDWWLRRRRGAR